MIVLTLCLVTSDDERPAALRTLKRILEPTRVRTGCGGCDLFQDSEQPNRIELVERWEDEQPLLRHLRSRDFRAVLAVIDMSITQPEVRFDWVTRTRGLGFIEESLSAR